LIAQIGGFLWFLSNELKYLYWWSWGSLNRAANQLF